MEKIVNFIEFSTESMNWCKAESEDAITNIMDIVNHLADDASRVSSVSAEALDALRSLGESIADLQEKDKVGDLSSILTEFKDKHDHIGDIINPIVQSLQFQDRVTQNLDNIKRMLDYWWSVRGSELSLQEFGEELLKKTTMQEERDLIRGVIDGLSEEQEQKGAILF